MVNEVGGAAVPRHATGIVREKTPDKKLVAFFLLHEANNRKHDAQMRDKTEAIEEQ